VTLHQQGAKVVNNRPEQKNRKSLSKQLSENAHDWRLHQVRAKSGKLANTIYSVFAFRIQADFGQYC